MADQSLLTFYPIAPRCSVDVGRVHNSDSFKQFPGVISSYIKQKRKYLNGMIKTKLWQ